VVVSDDSDGMEAPLTEAAAAKWNCRYIKGPKRGLYANRNYAALACRGTHIRTMDDDHEFPANHMEQCLRAVESDPDAIWTTGELGEINGYWLPRANYANQLEPSGVGETIKDPDDNWAVADGSTLYPRSIFDQGYRMVEDYPYGSSYLEFGAYLYHKGFKSRAVKEAYVIHHVTEESISRNSKLCIASRLFASFCYNFYFKPNYFLAFKYLISYSWRLRSFKNTREIFLGAKNRWLSTLP
jgi:glycosyltransferase involved in cell wall biosynthesis